MDVNVNVKRTKNRKRKRHSKVKRREQARLEVRFAKRRKLVPERNAGGFKSKEKLTQNNMHANTFWENYAAAHEWQRRHSVEWWKSRCVALEQENAILRDKIRELVFASAGHRVSELGKRNVAGMGAENLNNELEERPDLSDREEISSDNENLEFQVDEEMMRFFEQSIKHKLELKEKRDVEHAIEKAEQDLEQSNIEIRGGAAWMEAKTEAAKLLYGVSSPRILAMETALQATMDRHKDRAKPQFWPNIPLNL